ncbi:hypothetical protein [Rhizobium phaseoli]|nr:hypothetical protein [Rhizobium phaseoli]
MLATTNGAADRLGQELRLQGSPWRSASAPHRARHPYAFYEGR